MTSVEWVPGAHHTIVRDGVVVLLAEDVTREQVLRVWQALDAPAEVDGLGGLLDTLRDVTGRGLGSLPSFAMSVVDDRGLHVAARGTFNAYVIDLDDTEHVVRGGEASVWAERNFDQAAVAEIRLGDDDLDGTWLPVLGGVLPAAGVRQRLVERAEAEDSAPENAAPDAAPEDDVAPVPTPGRRVSGAHETWIEPEPGEELAPTPAAVEEPDPEPEPEPEVEAEPAPAPEAAPRRFASLLSPHTVMHDVEEAAVRPPDADADADAVGPSLSDAPDAATPPVAPGPAAAVPDHSAAADAVPAPRPVEPAPAPTPPSFISGVPSRSAYVPPPPPAPAPVLTDADGPEHHDGHTMFEAPDSTELDAYLSDTPPAPDNDSVLGVLCPAGHGNPTHRTECRVCGQWLAGDSVRFARPGLGWMHTSAGESIELVQNVLAGRNPRASRIQGTVMPRLLPLPHSHVSGTHLEIRLEGWSVMVADLGSTNGTFLQRPGQPTVRISETAQLLQSDDVVQLGHGVDLRFEALP
ncbi:FHA domain-containing protein [Nocardioides zhouii]|uniref:FHA domain-containing protein n=1 Tax=Nocardioides zhouii TaxID=1168729 RepID=A0A4Q2T2Y4_9ACTN|nr:FHA domain-containing protein [Nocardioides zhouii]RYC11059.1 FHA domain-containing protein [Nocardioides zhouii]